MTTLQEAIGSVPADEAIERFNIEVFGDYGTGKTHLIGTAADHPQTSPVLLIDIEGGAATLRKRPEIQVVQVRTMNQMVTIHNELKKRLLADDAEDDPTLPKTVAVDSLTELQRLDLAEIQAIASRDNDKEDPDIASQRGWGKTLAHMRQICRAYKDLPCNVIFTALAVKNIDKGTGEVTIWPAMQGRCLFEIPGFFDVVAYLDTIIEKDKIERRLITAGHPIYKAKDRLGVSNGKGYVLNPTVPMLFNNLNS